MYDYYYYYYYIHGHMDLCAKYKYSCVAFHYRAVSYVKV